MILLRAAEREAVPWKNGGGLTSDVAIYPDGASLHNFDWRVSIAQIQSNGPFSLFPGIDRHLVVLDGKMNLMVDQQMPVKLDQQTGAVAFPGDLYAKAELITASLTDLNVMVRRDRFRAEVLRYFEGREQVIEMQSDITLLVSAGNAEIGSHWLAPQDAVLIEGSLCGPILMTVESGCVHVVRILRTNSPEAPSTR